MNCEGNRRNRGKTLYGSHIYRRSEGERWKMEGKRTVNWKEMIERNEKMKLK